MSSRCAEARGEDKNVCHQRDTREQADALLQPGARGQILAAGSHGCRRHRGLAAPSEGKLTPPWTRLPQLVLVDREEFLTLP